MAKHRRGRAIHPRVRDLAGIGFGLRTIDPIAQGSLHHFARALATGATEISNLMRSLSIVLAPASNQERALISPLRSSPRKAFEESARAGGVIDEDEDIGGDDEASRASMAFDQLRRFEKKIPRFIASRMSAVFGDDWAQHHHLPPKVLEDWIFKRDAAVKAGQEELPLIEYADFSHYRLIIERPEQLEEAFSLFSAVRRISESAHAAPATYPDRDHACAHRHARRRTAPASRDTRRILKAVAATRAQMTPLLPTCTGCGRKGGMGVCPDGEAWVWYLRRTGCETACSSICASSRDE